ncbi:MAG: MerR family transcriptional regulator [Myxococcota bacterium]
MHAVGIQEAAQQTGMTAHTLRYYERIGLIVDLERDEAGHRRFSDENLRWLVFLTKLRRTGMHIRQMVRYAELLREGSHTAAARAQLLEDHRDEVLERIAELQSHLGVLDAKIQMYRTGALT